MNGHPKFTPRPGGKRCTHCHNQHPWADYANHLHTIDGKQSWCRACKTQAMRDHRARRKTAA